MRPDRQLEKFRHAADENIKSELACRFRICKAARNLLTKIAAGEESSVEQVQLAKLLNELDNHTKGDDNGKN